MSLSIEELDATVRNFYEGRGEAVRYQSHKNLGFKANARDLSKNKLNMP
jgi:hypothetical protein